MLVVLLGACSKPVIQPDVVPPSASAAPAVVTPPSPKAATERAWKACRETKPKSKASVASVRDVDWCNHPFVAGICTPRDGVGELHEYEELGGMHDTHICRLGAVAFGDLDGDGVDEAAVVVDEESHFAKGGSSRSSTVYVYGFDGSGPRLRAHAGIGLEADVSIDAGLVVLAYTDASRGRCRHTLRLAAPGETTALEPAAAETCG